VIRCEDTISGVLEWLWDNIAESILQKLKFVARPVDDSLWPKIVWCLTGLLTYLPIHAAGYHREAATHRTVIDRVISSYTSTIRLLKHSRAKVPDFDVVHKALIATVPQTSLRLAEAEAAVVKQRIRKGLQVQHIEIVKDITAQALHDEIPDKTIVHFVCHATSDSNPSSSRLLLSDGDFKVAEIAQMNLQRGALAYLSACSTAFSEGRSLDDECITLSAAFQVAGFARVIGTLWDAEDRISLAVAQAFYGGLDNNLSNSSMALHHAIRRIRDLHRASPSLWAPYVYFGA
jgi:CHAT domain-containing protein